ncbi:uncharacterized protein PHALS_12116 [Plasmopara halstedii]|uniref:Uncharacterized protein n=1 Tax=Plasmopara halstedii TaxID=4781 RepID=A0A0P1ALK4_PLAHL|nr:uncharacterized protein PHALS_12116 [Plasmopara halstedii]CEG41791.1 hypothetical protein PHALS_12116 [Plasmopara halstedii]|eukprot:XP_024578160.1 hypothetical protein PHALS_12116 [Plasmopara halstedii]
MTDERSLYDQFSDLIGHPTHVKLRNGTYTYGILYCIDPETDHVALLCPSGHESMSYNMNVVFAHNIYDIEKWGHEDMNISTLAALQQKLKEGLNSIE